MWKLQALFTFFVSLGITAFIIPKILLISFRKQLFDFNDGRKVHTGIVPRLGGVAFTPAIVIAVAFLLGFHTAVLNTESELFRSPKLGLGLCALLVPCFDVIRVMIHRMRRGKNPFMPDRNHIHHKFLALGMSHHTAMLIILAISAFFALLNISLQSLLNINIILVMDIMIWTVFHLWLSKMIRNRRCGK